MAEKRKEDTEVIMEPLGMDDLEEVAGGVCNDGGGCVDGDGCIDGAGCNTGKVHDPSPGG